MMIAREMKNEGSGQIVTVRNNENSLTTRNVTFVPQTIGVQGEKAAKRFLTYFTDNIRNLNTRVAYHANCCAFFDWCESNGLEFEDIQSFHVSAYIELLMKEKAPSTVKQNLASLRMLFDWLVVGQILEVNPAHAVRGPKHVVDEGVTPILTGKEVSQLFESFTAKAEEKQRGMNVVELRDRALIGVMAYSFARVEATVSLNVQDYYPQGKKWWLKLKEKNGKTIKMPAHHKLEEYLDEYIEAAELSGGKKVPIFQSTRGQSKTLTGKRLHRQNVINMVRRRAKDAGIITPISCHSFRGSGITNFLENNGKLEDAQRMAGHSSARTTKLYDRRNDAIKLDEVEKISF